MKSKHLGLFIAVMLIAGLVPFANLSSAVSVTTTNLELTYIKGETITFNVTIDTEGIRIPIEDIDVVFGNTMSFTCSFTEDGLNLSGPAQCMSVDLVPELDYGYGYSVDFGYGYGYLGELKYTITLDSSIMTLGLYSLVTDVNTGGPVLSSSPSAFTLLPPTVDYIVIEDAANVAGTEIPDQPVNVGFTIQGWAASYNNVIGYMGDVSVTWTVTGQGSAAPGTGITSTYDAGLAGGAGTWKADDGAGHDDTVVFTVAAPTVDTIVIEDAASGAGSEIADQPVNVGFSIPGWAASYNTTAGYIGDIPVTWSVIPSGTEDASTTGDGGVEDTFNAGNKGGTVKWWANDGSGHLDNVTFTITPPTTDYIQIDDLPGGVGTEIIDQNRWALWTIEGRAVAYNTSSGYNGEATVTWTVANALGATAFTTDGTGSFDEFNAGNTAGVAMWQVDDGNGHTDTVVFTISPPTIDNIFITANMTGGWEIIPDSIVDVGEGRIVWADIYNGTTNFLYTIDANWTVYNNGSTATITNSAGVQNGNGTNSTFYSGITGGVAYLNVSVDLNGTLFYHNVTITVNEPTMDYIRIVDGNNTGVEEIGNQTINVGTTFTGFVATFNTTAGYIGDISANWSLKTQAGAESTIDNESLIRLSNNFTAGNKGGDANWSAAVYLGGVWYNDSVLFTITPPTIDRIDMEITANGAAALADLTVYVGWTKTVWLATYNTTAGYLGPVSPSWTLENTNGAAASISVVTGTSESFDAGIAGGTAEWNASYMDASQGGKWFYDSVELVITPPVVYMVLIRDNAGGIGTVIPDMTAYVGWDKLGYAAAYNLTVGYVYDTSCTWTVVNANGATASANDGTGASDGFMAGTSAGTATWTADDGNGNADNVVFTITPPTVDYIQIVDSSDTGMDMIDYMTVYVGWEKEAWAAGFNITGGDIYVVDVEVTWTVENFDGASAYTENETGDVDGFGDTATFFADVAGGSANWTASYLKAAGLWLNDTINFTINAPTVDWIVIEDAAGGSGSAIADQDVTLGYSIIGFAIGYNETGGDIYVNDMNSVWSLSNNGEAIGTTSGGTIYMNTYEAGDRGGSAEWTAHDNIFGKIDSVVFIILDDLKPVTESLLIDGQVGDLELGSSVEELVLSATVQDLATGYGTITDIEYFMDTIGADGTGVAMTSSTRAFDGANETASITIDISEWSVGDSHTFYVHGFDGTMWSEFLDVTVSTFDNQEPVPDVTTVVLEGVDDTGGIAPEETHITITIELSDLGTGDQNLAGAELFFDVLGAEGAGYVMEAVDGAFDSPTELVTITIPIPDGWKKGEDHSILVRGVDVDGNWGGAADIPVRVLESVDEPSEFPWWILIVAAAVVFLLIIVVVKRKGGDEEDADTDDLDAEDGLGGAVVVEEVGAMTDGPMDEEVPEEEMAKAEEMECPTCGETINAGISVCPSCGEEFDWEEKEVEVDMEETEEPVDMPEEDLEAAAAVGVVETTPSEPVDAETPDEELVEDDKLECPTCGGVIKVGIAACPTCQEEFDWEEEEAEDMNDLDNELEDL